MDGFRILIADDHFLVRLGLRLIVESHDGWEVCGEAIDGRDAVKKCKQLKPDLLILDICMPRLNGLDAARFIFRSKPTQKILVVTDVDSEEIIQKCLQMGVRGWVWKSDEDHDLIQALEALQKNQTFFTSRVAELVLKSYVQTGKNHPADVTLARLSPREREVMQLISEGKITKEVAATLGVSVKTAETHRSNIMRKLSIHSIAQLVLYAVRNNIIKVALPDLSVTDTTPTAQQSPLLYN